MKAVIDTNVLFPTILREILADIAAAGMFTPFWSARILDEWRHVAARIGPEAAQVAGAEIALLGLRFPHAVVADDGASARDIHLPDAADVHIVQTALNCGAGLIVTANLRDFPRHVMIGFGLRAIHPDAFLLDLASRDGQTVQDAIEAARARAAACGGGMSTQEMLKRARLPRIAKALRA